MLCGVSQEVINELWWNFTQGRIVKRGFHPTHQRTQRKEHEGRHGTDARDVRNVTKLRHYGIGLVQTAAANHSRRRRRRMPLARCQAVADTPENMKLLKLNFISIINCTTSKNLLNFGLLIFYKKKFNLNIKKLEFSWKEDSSVRFLRELRSFRSLRVCVLSCVRCVGNQP